MLLAAWALHRSWQGNSRVRRRMNTAQRHRLKIRFNGWSMARPLRGTRETPRPSSRRFTPPWSGPGRPMRRLTISHDRCSSLVAMAASAERTRGSSCFGLRFSSTTTARQCRLCSPSKATARSPSSMSTLCGAIAVPAKSFLAKDPHARGNSEEGLVY